MAPPLVSNPPEPRNERLRALGPYLDKLRDWNGGSTRELGETGRSARVRVGNRAVELNPWERGRIREGLIDERVRSDVARLLAQGTALLVKCLVDVDRMCHDPHLPLDTLYRYQAELMLDTAIGTALLRECQDLIDRRVLAGEVEQAKQLTAFRHKLHRMVVEVRRLLTESERLQAEALSDEWAASVPSAPAGEGDLERLSRGIDAVRENGPAAAGPSRTKRRRRRSKRAGDSRATGLRPPSRTKALGVALGLLTILWLLSVRLPREFATVPVLLTPGDTSRPELFQAFDARPPSLFVTLAPGAWEPIGEIERRRIVKELARLAEESGYIGLLARTDRGRPAGQWIAGRGVTLLEPLEAAEAADAPTDLRGSPAVTPPGPMLLD